MKLLLALLALSVPAWAVEESPVEQVVRPREIDDVLVNPGMGFTTFQTFNGESVRKDLKWAEGYVGKRSKKTGGNTSYPDSSLAYVRIYWRVLEPENGR